MYPAIELQVYSQFLQISRALLQLAEAGDWEVFQQQLDARQALTARLEAQETLDAVVHAGLADELRLMIAEIHAVNETIGVVAETVRDTLSAEIRQNIQTHKAINAYRG